MKFKIVDCVSQPIDEAHSLKDIRGIIADHYHVDPYSITFDMPLVNDEEVIHFSLDKGSFEFGMIFIES